MSSYIVLTWRVFPIIHIFFTELYFAAEKKEQECVNYNLILLDKTNKQTKIFT